MEGKKMTIREQVVELVMKGIERQDYNYIRKAMSMCSDENGVFMAEDEDFVMVDDDLFYFNGAF
jgi:hypothetical protein